MTLIGLLRCCLEDIILNRAEYQALKEQADYAQLLSRQLEELKQRLDALTPTPIPTPTPAPRPDPQDSPEKSYKANPPAPFSGDREQIETFLSRCRHVFLVSPRSFTQETQKVLYASTYLEGVAYSWFKPILRAYEASLRTDSPTPIPAEFASFTAFENALTVMYGDPDLVRSMIRELKALQQTTTVAAYASEFRRISAYIGWTDDVLMTFFYDGLRGNVKDCLTGDPAVPKSLDDLIALALKWDNRIIERLIEKRTLQVATGNIRPRQQVTTTLRPSIPVPQPIRTPPTAFPATPRPMFPLPTPTLTDGSTPMELDKTQRYPILTPEQKAARRQYRIDNNLCTYCGSPNHRVEKCPICPPNRSAARSNHAVTRFTLVPETDDGAETNISTNDDVQE